LSEFSKEKRIFVPIQNIPQDLIEAFLAAEDSNFYSHSGIDLMAIMRAAIKNVISLISEDKISGGGSTITQQVVKNFLLSNERTLQRKIKEAILAVKMTSNFTKEEVLELYLNQIYLGSGSYGVAAAAQAYFDKSIDSLEIEEMALLATLPKAPSKLDPRKNIKKAKIRRDWVINRMRDEGFITKKEAKKAAQNPIILNEKSDSEIVKANFFSDAVKKELTGLYGSDNVFESGIVVRTTLDPELQEYASEALQNGIERYDMKHGYRGALGIIDEFSDWKKKLKDFSVDKLYKETWKKALVLVIEDGFVKIGIEDDDQGIIEIEQVKWARKYIDANNIGVKIEKISDVLKLKDIIMVEKINDSDDQDGKNKYYLRQIPEANGAFLAMDPHSGRILAMMGGYIDAVNQFNRATQAKRQPGSIMKTFGYIAALENGLTPASIIVDEPIILDQGEDLPLYQPTNYSGRFYGPRTLRFGLENSINIVTVKMADQVGLDKVSEVISRFGINKKPKRIYSSVLGSIESNLLNVVSGYSAIVNGGKKVSPTIIEKIQDRTGKTIHRKDQRSCLDCALNSEEEKTIVPFLEDNRERLTDSATSYQISSMLEGVVKRGTSRRARAIGKVVGGKTGTTNNSIDSWFVGFTPDLVVGIYVGFDIPRTLGKYETGSSLALPVFVDFMKKSLKDTPSTPFRVPNDVKFVKIDRTTGNLPTPYTPKKDIIFEAFKLHDIVEHGSQNVIGEEDAEGNGGNIGFY
jgi:penicillin-binding protein 1A